MQVGKFVLSALFLGGASAGGIVPAMVSDLEKVHIRLEGIREKCLIEEQLSENTVVLVKHVATTWNSVTNMRVDMPLQLVTTVRDPSGHTVVRQQSKPNDRLFLTAATTGDHLICFQAMLTQYSPNVITKLGLEVFIGDPGDPHITSPVEATLTGLAFQISKAVDGAADLQREQSLQREREQHFRAKSDRVNSKVFWYAVLQILILAGAAVYQVYTLRRFFKSKKLV